jgi:hypothetical protein
MRQVSRDQCEKIIIKHGGSVAKSVTNKVDYLINGDFPDTHSKKCKDAEAKGVEIVDEAWIANTIYAEKKNPIQRLNFSYEPNHSFIEEMLDKEVFCYFDCDE